MNDKIKDILSKATPLNDNNRKNSTSEMHIKDSFNISTVTINSSLPYICLLLIVCFLVVFFSNL